MGWTPEPVWKVWGSGKILTSVEFQTLDPSARSLVGLPAALLQFPTVRKKTDGMSDIHNIYCCRVLRIRVPLFSSSAACVRLHRNLPALAEFEPTIPVYVAQNRARVRPHDIRDWYPTVSLKHFRAFEPVLMNTCL